MLKHENNSINKAWIKYIIRLSFHVTNYIEQSIGTINTSANIKHDMGYAIRIDW